MRVLLVCLAAVGCGALCEERAAPSLTSFHLTESVRQVQAILGPPEHRSSGPGHFVLEFNELAVEDEGNYAWSFYFDVREGVLMITRKYADPMRVADLLPKTESRVVRYPLQGPPSLILLRRDLGDRILLAECADASCTSAAQFTLVRKTALPRFYPWMK